MACVSLIALKLIKVLEMNRERTGTYHTVAAAGENARAFVPLPLPPIPALELTGARQLLLEQATLAVGQLDSLSPLAVLGRGYSLTRLLPSGVIVRSAAQTRPGDAIEILLRQGALDARVERLKERDDRPQV